MPKKSAVENRPIGWIARHAAFCDTDLYRDYHECLRLEREEILLRGKKTRDPHILSMLEGFDQAASFFQRAVDTLREQNKQKSEEIEDESQQDY